MIFGLAIAISSWSVVQNLVQIFLLRLNWKNHYKPLGEALPLVSVLIAVRDEELELPYLLKSLDEIDYPVDLLEIMIADDHSTDGTAELLSEWSQKGKNRQIVSLGYAELGKFHRNGKANALAILGQQAKGELFFFTDGDCVVPKNWIREGVGSFHGDTGILIGATYVRERTWLDRMQALDWWTTLGIVKVVTDLGLPTTGLGNNMVISGKAYRACGGFEGLSSSLTEDLEMSKAVVCAGYRIRQQVSPEMLAQTKAEYSWAELLRQRKRWVSGAMTLSWEWKILLGLQVFFFPAVFLLIYLNILIGSGIWLMKMLAQAIFIDFFAKKAGRKTSFSALLVYDFYQIASYSLTILYYFWPSSVQWKARKYP